VKNNIKKIVLTGGHAKTTAKATIEELEHRNSLNTKLYWISKETPGFSIKFKKIYAGKIQKKLKANRLTDVLLIPVGFFQAFYFLLTIRPNLVLSFGGYAALPVVFSAFILRIPIVIQEQISTAGMANKLSAKFAKKIAIGRIESRKHFPKGKTVLTGIPISKYILKIKPKRKIGTPPTLFITGGSRGSQILNETVEVSLNKLLEKYKIIHLTGFEDYSKFMKIKSGLNNKISDNYKLLAAAANSKQMAKFFKKSDILLSRAGANTVAEIIATGRPAILIPIPWSWNNEQLLNARLAKKAGIALILDQNKLNEANLLNYLNKLSTNRLKMVNTYDRSLAKLDAKASCKLVDILEELIK